VNTDGLRLVETKTFGLVVLMLCYRREVKW